MSFEDLQRARNLVDEGDQVGASEIYIDLLKKCYDRKAYLAAVLLTAEAGCRDHARAVLLGKYFPSTKDARDIAKGIEVDLHISHQDRSQMYKSNDTLHRPILEEAFSLSSQ